jgi:acyl transferase domain-containing protein/NAD(P)-dependent dehydrogenase (short-subunit alcohol dehydrogenase family)/acyl carrier protein
MDALPHAELSPVKQALLVIRDLEAKLAAAESARHEPIAIVGMACRYPGCANLAAFWRLLIRGGDAITEVPPHRWDLDAVFDPDPSRPGTMTSRWAGLIDKLDEFDAAFFGISPREAPHVDPRQRLALEVAWEALEHAGIPPDSLAGTRAGVFMATLTNDYDHLLFADLRRADAYSGAGTANSIVANRLSYFLDLHGPSVALDTACSGSLVAVHLACESLRRGESSLALAGGVNVNLMPKSNVFFSKAGALSPTGRCRTFDRAADGMVRSDGAGIIVLKRLSQAQADGDTIAAIIRGSAVNHDGRSNGLMAPNGEAQKSVLTEAYRIAGIAPADVQYIEAHGTGTRLGDPIEVSALGDVLTQNRPADRRCLLGSVKTNIGHSEAAAAIAGIIKTALAMQHRVVPPTVHFTEANPLIPFDRLPFSVPREASPWPSPDRPLIAGISGFGFGGTNAHVVLENAPPDVADGSDADASASTHDVSADAAGASMSMAGAAVGTSGVSVRTADASVSASAVSVGTADPSVSTPGAPVSAPGASVNASGASADTDGAALFVLPLSARTPRALVALAKAWRDRLADADADANAGSLCAAAARGRTHHAHRVAIVGESAEALRSSLDRWLGAAAVTAAAATTAAATAGTTLAATAATDTAPAAVSAAAAPVVASSATVAATAGGHADGPGRLARSGGPDARLVFVFSGQGSHWPRMGLQLYAREPVFAAAIDACDRLFAQHGSHAIRDEIARDADSSRLDDTAITQPAIFATQMALHALWRSWGITPSAVIGHSLGEVAAACAAGVLTLDEGVRVVHHRSRLMARTAGRGRTAVVGLSLAEAREAIRGYEPALAVAGSNSPGMSVIAGDPVSVDRMQRMLDARDIFCRVIPGVSVAFHSPQMDPLRHELVQALADLDPKPATVPIVSTVTGAIARGETFDADYWGRNLREPFLFAQAVDGVLREGGDAFLEVSPHPVLASSIAQCVRHADATATATATATAAAAATATVAASATATGVPILCSLRRGEPDAVTMLRQLGALYELGQPVRWPQVYRTRPRAVSVPTYPWQRQRFWFDQLSPASTVASTRPAAARDDRAGVATTPALVVTTRLPPASAGVHPLLGEPIEPAVPLANVPGTSADTSRVCLWDMTFAETDPPFVADHRVRGSVVLPGAAILEIAGAAARQLWADRTTAEPVAVAVTDLLFEQALQLSDGPRRAQATLTVRAGRPDDAEFAMYSRRIQAGRGDGAWTRHATGRVTAISGRRDGDRNDDGVTSLGDALEGSAPGRIDALKVRCPEPVAPEAHYEAMKASGLDYGPAFRGIRGLWVSSARPAGAGADHPTAITSAAAIATAIAQEALADIVLDPTLADSRYAVHPAMLDAALQTVAAVVRRSDAASYLPRGVRRWQVYRPAADRLWCHARVTGREGDLLAADLDLFDNDGTLLARMEGLTLARLGASRRPALEESLIAERWEPRPLAAATASAFASPSPSPSKAESAAAAERREGTAEHAYAGASTSANGAASAPAKWLLLADAGGVADTLADRLRARGADVIIARRGSASRRVDAHHVELTADCAADMTRVIADAGALTGVIHLWSLDAPLPDDTLSAVAAAETLGYASALHLTHALLKAAAAPPVPTPATATLSATAAAAAAGMLSADLLPSGAPAATALVVALSAMPAAAAPVTSDFASPPRLWIVTRGAQAIGGGSIAVQHAPLHGLALTLAQEHPELRCTTVDLDPAATTAGDAAWLDDEVMADTGESRVAWRDGVRHVARVVRVRSIVVAPHAAGASSSLRADATYLISGGLGALGLQTAAHLATRGARHLVLTGRRGVDDKTAATIQEIERQHGATVTVVAADIADAADVERIFADVLPHLPPLAGVVHAAGVLDDALVAQQTVDRFRRVLAPKVAGAWNLHVRTRALPLDFFVCYSSAASLVGSAGQANYAAGNAFLDALAHHRRALGLRALSINWGAWAGDGMAGGDRMRGRLDAHGLSAIQAADGLAVLSRLIESERHGDADACPAAVGVFPVDWTRFLRQFPAGVPLRFSALAPTATPASMSASASVSVSAPASASASKSSPVSALGVASAEMAGAASDRSNGIVAPDANDARLNDLLAMPARERGAQLRRILRDELAAVLRIDASAEIGLRDKYFDLGMDSLTAVEFKNRLHHTFDLPLPATLAFDYPTIDALATRIETTLAGRARTRSTPSPVALTDADLRANQLNAGQLDADRAETRPADLDHLDALAAHEIAALLARELDEEAPRVR